MALDGFRCAQGAEFWDGDRRGCLKGTRIDVLDQIELWIRDFTRPPVFWLNGLAGTGKTVIAQTIAERTFADGQLGASFFCSQDFPNRSNVQFIFPTLAVQLARKYKEFRSLFVPLIRSNSGIPLESLYNQMRKLIVRPLKESKISTVIIIDSLDECTDEEPASAILSVLGQLVSEIPMVKFLITGRPEPRIWGGFRILLWEKSVEVFVLHEVEPKEVAIDMMLIFRYALGNVARHHGLGGWPAEEQLRVLCERAAGLFVYAAATIKFIGKKGADPRERLDLLLQSPESSELEAKTKFRGNTTIDSLYTSILQGAFGDDNDPSNDLQVRSVLGAMVLAADPLSPSTIATLLDLDPLEDVLPILLSVQSLLIPHANINSPVRPFHKSFHHFIIDPGRCTNKRLHVSPPAHHSGLLFNCLDLMNQKLKNNMCQLPDAVPNSDISDLKEKVERYLDPALQYACLSWHTHLVGGYPTSVHGDGVASALRRFFETKFLFWLEVLSVLGAVSNAVGALQAAVDRLKVRLHSILGVLPKYAQSWFRNHPYLTLSAAVPASYPATPRLSPHPPRLSITWRPPTINRGHPPRRTAARV